MVSARELVERLSLLPHPEGGFFRETYRSATTIGEGPARRSVSTAILYLLPKGATSRFHRIRSDELWHFHLGGPLMLTMISPAGKLEEVTLGSDLAKGQHLQYAVPAGTWFGSTPAPGSEFSLLGCTVAPGFDFADFELAERAELLELCPHARARIELLTAG